MVALDTLAIVQRLAQGDAGNTAVKGAALEAVVADTLCRLDGIGVLYQNAVDVAGSSEIDILLYNQRHPGGLPFLPENLLVECKNWAAPVDAATVRVLTSKMRAFRLEFGILVAASGITGSASDRTAAHAHLRSEFDRDGRKVIVLTRAELEGVASTEALGTMLRLKYAASIMGLDQL